MPQPKRGYRLRHEPCRRLNEDIERVQKHLDQLDELNLTQAARAELRYRLFCMTSQVPRLRTPDGRFAPWRK